MKIISMLKILNVLIFYVDLALYDNIEHYKLQERLLSGRHATKMGISLDSMVIKIKLLE